MGLRLPRLTTIQKERLGLALRAGGCVVAAAMFARVLAGVEWHATSHAVVFAGPLIVLALLPFSISLVLDTTGVLLLARAAGIDLRASTTLGVRVVSEALHFGAPGGVVASEAAALALFARRCHVDSHEATILVAGRKWLVMRAHAVYLAASGCIAAGTLAVIGERLGVHASLPKLVVASAVVPLALSVGLRGAITHMPGARARACLGRIARAKHVTALATLVFLAQWLVECAETAVLLRLLGAPLSMASVLRSRLASLSRAQPWPLCQVGSAYKTSATQRPSRVSA